MTGPASRPCRRNTFVSGRGAEKQVRPTRHAALEIPAPSRGPVARPSYGPPGRTADRAERRRFEPRKRRLRGADVVEEAADLAAQRIGLLVELDRRGHDLRGGFAGRLHALADGFRVARDVGRAAGNLLGI